MTEEDADALRRRLYRPEATEQDVDRYRTLVRESPDAPDAPAGPPPAARGATRPAALRATVVLGAVALLVAGTVALQAPPPAPRQRATGGLEPIAVSASARRTLVADLRLGRRAVLSDLFLADPDSRPTELWTTRRADTEETAGIGPRTLDLHPSALAGPGGRMTVVLVVAEPAPVTWRASRFVLTGHSTSAWQTALRTVAERSARYGPGLPRSATVRYAAPAPQVLRVSVPAGVRWSAAVVFSD